MKRFKSYLLLCPVAFLLAGYLIVTGIAGSQAPLSEKRSQALARETYERVYGLTAEQSAQCVLTDTRTTDTGYAFTYFLGQVRFLVTVNSADGSADCAPDAADFHALLEKPQEPDETSLAMKKWRAERGGLAFDFWTLEDKASFAERYYQNAAGFARYCGLPREGELTPDEALKLAKDTLTGKAAYTPEQLETFTVAAWFYRDAPKADGGTRSYYELAFWLDKGDGQYDYQTQVDIDAASGDIISLSELIGIS